MLQKEDPQHGQGYSAQEPSTPHHQEESARQDDDTGEFEQPLDVFSFLLELLDWAGEHEVTFIALLLCIVCFGYIVLVPLIQLLVPVLQTLSLILVLVIAGVLV